MDKKRVEKYCVSCIHFQVHQRGTGIIIFNTMVCFVHSTLKKGTIPGILYKPMIISLMVLNIKYSIFAY